MNSDNNARLLVVDDDPEDILLIKIAAKRAGIPFDIKGLADGQELMDYLAEFDQTHSSNTVEPDMLVFLDLNMPRKDGRTCLREIKDNPRYRNLPVIVFFTSDSPDDIESSYAMDANSYICKPGDFLKLEELLTAVYQYWFGRNEAPNTGPIL